MLDTTRFRKIAAHEAVPGEFAYLAGVGEFYDLGEDLGRIEERSTTTGWPAERMLKTLVYEPKCKGGQFYLACVRGCDFVDRKLLSDHVGVKLCTRGRLPRSMIPGSCGIVLHPEDIDERVVGGIVLDEFLRRDACEIMDHGAPGSTRISLHASLSDLFSVIDPLYGSLISFADIRKEGPVAQR